MLRFGGSGAAEDADDLVDFKDDVLGYAGFYGLPSTICVKLMLSSSVCDTDTLRSTLNSLVTTMQVRPPGMYFFHVVSRFRATMSPQNNFGTGRLVVVDAPKVNAISERKDQGHG